MAAADEAAGVKCLAGHGKQVAVLYDNGALRLHRRGNLVLLRELGIHARAHTVISLEGNKLATACNLTVKVWNTTTYEVEFELEHQEDLTTIAYAGLGYLLTGHYDGHVHLWSLEAEELEWSHLLFDAGPVTHLCTNRDPSVEEDYATYFAASTYSSVRLYRQDHLVGFTFSLLATIEMPSPVVAMKLQDAYYVVATMQDVRQGMVTFANEEPHIIKRFNAGEVVNAMAFHDRTTLCSYTDATDEDSMLAYDSRYMDEPKERLLRDCGTVLTGSVTCMDCTWFTLGFPVFVCGTTTGELFNAGLVDTREEFRLKMYIPHHDAGDESDEDDDEEEDQGAP